MSNFASSQFKDSLSIQSCFPDVRSTNSSFCNSSLDDYDNVNMECLNGDDASDSTGQPRSISHCLTFSHNTTTQLPLSRALSNSIDFAKVIVSEPQLNPSLWPVNTAAEHPAKISNYSAVLREAAVRYSGKAFEDMTRNSFTAYVPLHLAALKGDWNAARAFLTLDPCAVRARITCNLETALHIAAGARHALFVQELVKLMTPDDLALRNKVGNTALCFAAASGITNIAAVMVNKNNMLPSIRGSNGAIPLCMAALLGHRNMVWYLYSVTKDEDLMHADRIELLVAAITADLYDVALEVIQSYPELAFARVGNGETALHVLARKPSVFPSGCQLAIWQRDICSGNHTLGCPNIVRYILVLKHDIVLLEKSIFDPLVHAVPGISKIIDTKLMHIQALDLVKRIWELYLSLDDSKIGDLLRTPSRLLFTAAALGNVDLIILLIRMYPSLIWKVDENSQSIFHIAVVHRQGKIFNLIHEIGAHKDLIAAYKDENNNNMLHLAGKLAPSNRLKTDSGAALQLRRELHWFKEVEKIVQPSYREMKNSEGFTPHMLFSEEHKRLVREGEKWMKDTASSCMVVATLIATVMFAATFTVPGGYDNKTGMPIFLENRLFVVFAMSNALALFASASSIIMFLSVLTSRYAEEDFLHSLPNRLVIGLATLFISITTMMIAFAATLFIILGHGFAWTAIPVSAVACVPVILFALLQFPLVADMISHIYSSFVFFCPTNRLLY